ncbi:cupin domain-containing protein [Yinghuangia aomiensis]
MMPTLTWCEEVWRSSGQNKLGDDPAADPQVVEPDSGGTRFRVVTLGPEAEMRAAMAQAIKERASSGEHSDDIAFDEDGFHKTDTLDYILVLDGDIELVLDDETVTVKEGDVVVQRNTNHAWRNKGDKPVRLVTFMAALS